MVKSQQMTYQNWSNSRLRQARIVCPQEMALRCWFHQIHFLDSGLSQARIWPILVSHLPGFGHSRLVFFRYLAVHNKSSSGIFGLGRMRWLIFKNWLSGDQIRQANGNSLWLWTRPILAVRSGCILKEIIVKKEKKNKKNWGRKMPLSVKDCFFVSQFYYRTLTKKSQKN